MQPKHIKIVAIVVGLLILAWAASVFLGRGNKTEEVVDTKPSAPLQVIDYQRPADASPITGLSCDGYDKRTYAVMYSGDFDARHLFSNLSMADLVVEAPEQSRSDTRLMGVFGCNTPAAVGPMRSGRTDFLSIAGSLDAIFVPWGGSSISKQKLREGVVDHLDCNGEVAPSASGTPACFRKADGAFASADKEDRAFGSVPELISLATQQGYRSENKFSGFKHQGELPRDQRPVYGRLTVGFQKPFKVHYFYDPETNTYKREFNGSPDIDLATGEQIAPKNVVVIPAKAEHFRTDIDYGARGVDDPWANIDEGHRLGEHDRYNNMALGDPWFDANREGVAHFYFNGQEIIGTWKRERNITAPYQFFDGDGNEVHFVPGQIWIEVPEPGQTVKYKVDDEVPTEDTTTTFNVKGNDPNDPTDGQPKAEVTTETTQ